MLPGLAWFFYEALTRQKLALCGSGAFLSTPQRELNQRHESRFCLGVCWLSKSKGAGFSQPPQGWPRCRAQEYDHIKAGMVGPEFSVVIIKNSKKFCNLMWMEYMGSTDFAEWKIVTGIASEN